MERQKILITHNLSTGYPGFLLFEKLELSLFKGELVCFMGPNGVGKTTLIRTLCGLQSPIEGQVNFLDPVSSKIVDGQINQLVAVVLTDRITATQMSVYELVTYGRYPYLGWDIRLKEKDKTIIQNAIDMVNIGYLADKKLYQLSDGQLQMAMIARALAQDTPLIILDEPTAHLDLNNRVEIMKLLRQLTRTIDKTVLLATHDLTLALQTADAIWLTGNDKNIIEGIPEDLVLNGSFDNIFQFKGFDLKTGNMLHEPYRNIEIQVTGEGYPFLWTRNALERNGYVIHPNKGRHTISIKQMGDRCEWIIDQTIPLNNLVDVLRYIQKPDT